MGEKEWEAHNILDVFGDQVARQLLVLASQQPMTADEFTDHLDASAPTIYRRLNHLEEYNLITTDLDVDTDGNHSQTYETTLKRISLDIAGTGYDVSLTHRQDVGGQFGDFWNDLKEASPDIQSNADDSDASDIVFTEGTDG